MNPSAAPLPPQAALRTKAYALEIKSTDDADGLGRFAGIASAVGVLDHHGDVIEAGAFDATLATKGGTLPLLWQHDMTNPIGVIKVRVDAKAT